MAELQGPVPTVATSPNGWIKITILVRKLPNVSDDYFHAYWANNHVTPALKSAVFLQKVKKYNQYHITPETRELAARLGLPVLDYDGVAEVWVEKFDDWITASTDPVFVEGLKDDDKNFVAQPYNVLVGFDHLIHEAK